VATISFFPKRKIENRKAKTCL